MRKFIVLSLTLFFLLSYSSAQNSLKGKISDKTEMPLAGVSIYISDLNRGTISDSVGNYSIKNLPTGNFSVELKSMGFISVTVAISIKGDVIQDFILEESIAEFEPVVITGVPSSTIAKNNPISTISVNSETMLQNSSTNIVDAISKQPGVSQVSTGAAISKPVIRGLGYNRVISLYNGVRQEGQQWGDEHGIEIDEYSIDRVEIIKGPGSLMYGSDGIGGVVNFLSPKPVGNGEIRGSVISNYQSNNHLIGNSLMNTGNIRKIEWLARLSSKHAGNYSNVVDGKVYNSGFKELDFSGHLGTTRKWGYSQLYFTSFNQRVAMPEGERDSLGNFTKEIPLNDSTIEAQTVSVKDLKGYKINIPNQFIRHNRLLWMNTILFTNSSLRFTLGYQLNRRQEYGDVMNPGQYGLFFYMPTYNYDIKYYLPEYHGWKTTVGANGMYQKNQNRGKEFLIPDYHLFDIGSFIYFKRTIHKLNIAGGARIDRRTITSKDLYLDTEDLPTSSNIPGAYQKFSALDNAYKNYSGSLGATYEVSERVNIKTNLSRGYRAPNIAELASDGRHEGTFRYEYGNTALKAETNLQIDGGVTYNSKHVSLEASIFNNEIQNYIYAVRLRNQSGGDSVVNPLEPVPTYKYGQNNASLKGGEITLDIHPHPLDWLHFENSFSIVRGRNKNLPDSGKYLPFMPAPRYQSRLRANLKKTGNHLHNFYFLLELDHFFKQNQYLKENHTETSTPQYTLVNSGIGGDILDKNKKTLFSIYFTVNNLFNIAYQNHLNRLKYAAANPATGQMGIFNMGRNFSVKIVVPLNIIISSKSS